MPKDPWKNQPNYKIGGGQLNEYDFNQSHGELSKEESDPFAQQGLENPAQAGEGEEAAAPRSPQEAEAERIRQVIEAAHEKAQRGRKGGTATVSGAQPVEGDGAAKSPGARRGGSGSRGASKKAAKKSAAKKSAAEAAGSKAAGASASAAKKSAGRAGGASKKSAAKSGGARKAAGAKKAVAKKAGAKSAATAKASAARKGAAKAGGAGKGGGSKQTGRGASKSVATKGGATKGGARKGGGAKKGGGRGASGGLLSTVAQQVGRIVARVEGVLPGQKPAGKKSAGGKKGSRG